MHEEAQEDDIHDKFSDFGEIKNLQLPLDRSSGFVKGYALVEFEKQSDAATAIKGMCTIDDITFSQNIDRFVEMNGEKFMDKELEVDWAFVGRFVDVKTVFFFRNAHVLLRFRSSSK